MDSNGRTFSVLVPHCLLLSFWKKDVPPPETWHAILQLTKSRVNNTWSNGYPTITQHLALLFNYQFEALPILNPYKSQTNNVDLSTKVAIESLPTQYYSNYRGLLRKTANTFIQRIKSFSYLSHTFLKLSSSCCRASKSTLQKSMDLFQFLMEWLHLRFLVQIKFSSWPRLALNMGSWLSRSIFL